MHGKMPTFIVSMFLCCSTVALANLATFSEKKPGDDIYQRITGPNRLNKKRLIGKNPKSKKAVNRSSAA